MTTEVMSLKMSPIGLYLFPAYLDVTVIYQGFTVLGLSNFVLALRAIQDLCESRSDQVLQ